MRVDKELILGVGRMLERLEIKEWKGFVRNNHGFLWFPWTEAPYFNPQNRSKTGQGGGLCTNQTASP